MNEAAFGAFKVGFCERVGNSTKAEGWRCGKWGGGHCNLFDISLDQTKDLGCCRGLTDSVPAAGYWYRGHALHRITGHGIFEEWPSGSDSFMAAGIAESKCIVVIGWFGEIEGTSRGIVSVVGVEQFEYIVWLELGQCAELPK